MKSTRTRQLPAVTLRHFHSSSGPWMDHDGQDVWRTVKNNKGRLSSTRVYKFLSPPVHQVCVFSLRCHWKVCSIKNTTRAGRSERPRSSLALSLQLLRDKYFPATGPHIFFSFSFFFLGVYWSKVYVLGALWRLALSPSPPEPIHAAGMQRKPLMEREQQDTANIWIQQTEKLHQLYSVSFEERKKVSCREGERKLKQLTTEVWQRLRLNDKIRTDLKHPNLGKKKKKNGIYTFCF